MDTKGSVDNGANGIVKNPGCWTKFKSLFDGRGFDLEYEYNNAHSINVLETQNDFEGYRRIDDRKVSVLVTQEKRNSIKENLDGELTGVINFYEQFATLGDEPKDDRADLWKKASSAKHRVSMRPSMYLTNIAEETSSLDFEVDEIEEVSLGIYNSN